MTRDTPRGGKDGTGSAVRHGLPLAGILIALLAVFGPGPVACSVVAVVLGTNNEFRDACDQVSPGETWQQAGSTLERAGGSLAELPAVTGPLPEVLDWSATQFKLRHQSCSVETDEAGVVTGALYRSWVGFD